MVFRWWANDGPLLVVFGSSFPSSIEIKQTKKTSDLEPLWKKFLDPRMDSELLLTCVVLLVASIAVYDQLRAQSCFFFFFNMGMLVLIQFHPFNIHVQLPYRTRCLDLVLASFIYVVTMVTLCVQAARALARFIVLCVPSILAIISLRMMELAIHIYCSLVFLYLSRRLSVCFCLFDLILYVPSTVFQLYRDGSSWVEPVLS